jgi:hypothetical protein
MATALFILLFLFLLAGVPALSRIMVESMLDDPRPEDSVLLPASGRPAGRTVPPCRPAGAFEEWPPIPRRVPWRIE